MSADAEAAQRFVETRWPDGIRCPLCDSARVSERHRPERRWTQWRCRDCRKEFTAVTGTALHGTRLSPSQAEQRQLEDRGSTRRDPSQASGLSRGAKTVLNALRQRPLGSTIGKITEITNLSERHTRRLLRQLSEAGLALQRDGNVKDGHRMMPARLWELTYSSECIRLLGRIPRHNIPMTPPADSDSVPSHPRITSTDTDTGRPMWNVDAAS